MNSQESKKESRFNNINKPLAKDMHQYSTPANEKEVHISQNYYINHINISQNDQQHSNFQSNKNTNKLVVNPSLINTYNDLHKNDLGSYKKYNVADDIKMSPSILNSYTKNITNRRFSHTKNENTNQYKKDIEYQSAKNISTEQQNYTHKSNKSKMDFSSIINTKVQSLMQENTKNKDSKFLNEKLNSFFEKLVNQDNMAELKTNDKKKNIQ